MPESTALHDFKQAASDNIGIMSAHLTAENAGIESLLDEGRETTFNLVTTKRMVRQSSPHLHHLDKQTQRARLNLIVSLSKRISLITISRSLAMRIPPSQIKRQKSQP